MKKVILITMAVIISNCSLQDSQTKISDVPNWAKQAVWYQIFPERFNNGDKFNDPRPVDMAGAWPYITPKGWQVHPWTSDWYKLQPWEKATGNDFYGNAGIRRYGGDLQGIINKLDYLEELGINAIYLNPIFESPSLHKYDAAMYRHIDNNFGPNPDLDKEIWESENPMDETTWKFTSADSLFLKLITKSHEKGIKIIIDGVFNHVGNNYWAFKDLIKNQEKSEFKDWFYVKSFDDPKTDENEFDYEGWYGVKDLPEIREDENGLVAGAAEHVHKIVKRWMDPNNDGDPSDGIDGWRLDVAEMVDHNFWKIFRNWVKDINPDAYITGEVWWEDWNKNKMFNAAPWLQGDEFDAVMNYRFTRALKQFVVDDIMGIGPKGFIDSLSNQYNDYDNNHISVLMNLLGSHDTERLASLIINKDHWYDHHSMPGQNKDWDVRKPNSQEIAKQKLMVGIQMTLPGAPHIYYGDEAGMWGGDDPDDRKPMVWDELKYETEKTHPFGFKRPFDKVEFNRDLFEFYKKVIGIRKANSVLSLGEVEFKVINNEKEILSFKRFDKIGKFYVFVNNNSESNSINVNDIWNDSPKRLTDLITGTEIANGVLNLEAYQIVICK